MDFNFYWRGTDKNLHHIAVSNEDSLQDARQAVMEHLHTTKEVFLLPLLCLIKCGTIPVDIPKEVA